MEIVIKIDDGKVTVDVPETMMSKSAAIALIGVLSELTHHTAGFVADCPDSVSERVDENG